MPTVGWVGRDIVRAGRHVKRPQLFVDAVQTIRTRGIPVVARMYGGQDLVPYASALSRLPNGGHASSFLVEGDRSVASLQAFYASLDCLVVTCESEPGPLTIYEALACGVPVVTTATGAADACGDAVRVASEERLASKTRKVLKRRRRLFRDRGTLAAAVSAFSHEAWAAASVRLAMELVP